MGSLDALSRLRTPYPGIAELHFTSSFALFIDIFQHVSIAILFPFFNLGRL
jgi:hypothetical protein